MAEATQPIESGKTCPSLHGWCDYHQGPSGTAVLITSVDQGDGPGYGLYACAPCREQRHLTPYRRVS